MPALERVRIRSGDLAPEDYPYETPKEVQGTTHKFASRQLEHALDLHMQNLTCRVPHPKSGVFAPSEQLI